MLCTEINRLKAQIHTEKEALVKLESIMERMVEVADDIEEECA